VTSRDEAILVEGKKGQGGEGRSCAIEKFVSARFLSFLRLRSSDGQRGEMALAGEEEEGMARESGGK